MKNIPNQESRRLPLRSRRLPKNNLRYASEDNLATTGGKQTRGDISCVLGSCNANEYKCSIEWLMELEPAMRCIHDDQKLSEGLVGGLVDASYNLRL